MLGTLTAQIFPKVQNASVVLCVQVVLVAACRPVMMRVLSAVQVKRLKFMQDIPTALACATGRAASAMLCVQVVLALAHPLATTHHPCVAQAGVGRCMADIGTASTCPWARLASATRCARVDFAIPPRAVILCLLAGHALITTSAQAVLVAEATPTMPH